MALSNAERQRLHRQRTKDKLATAGEAKRTTAAIRSAGPFSDAEFTADEKLAEVRRKLRRAQDDLEFFLCLGKRSPPIYIDLCRRDLRLWQEIVRDYERLVGAPDGYVTLEHEECAADAERVAMEKRRLARAS